ncbi:SH3 and multiple ankyrin repeat domains protein 2-like [Sinocyclocheilus anshuiensis]|uniref:SH3 and multiple ankyrin repeat domains protein 2-like n=1 Tax=Sinocyclocheilus anshuiensis TaxID=1608454 RepID=UPI0007B7DDCB|nr:PREDICTED: SH3 and multiple ankyrin repeat domains protein 2-like [Sinocyclocheilus anshuiensis]
MTRSPASSEDEMAQSVSDHSQESSSESFKEEAIYETIRTQQTVSRMTDVQSHSLVIRVNIPDLQQTKVVRFDPSASVWAARQRLLCTLSQNLKDVLNYGLFQPASDDRNGQFLDEEQLVAEYPQLACEGIPSLEFRYKTRLYDQPGADEKQIAKLHTKANLRWFIDCIQHHQLEKLSKMLDRGLDPNYHDMDTGETPLTIAAQLENMVEFIKALRHGGAHLDFRAKDGMTALHKAACSKNQATLKTLLELGASPNYKDSRGLTALYHTAVVGGDTDCCELLLNQNASVCCQDENGWHEIHQACRHGHVQHLEHLLFFGADMSAQNASGNTALHICALYNQEKCAHVLLVRGADKELKNCNNQSPFQVAIISGNFELAELIKKHRESDVVRFPEVPLNSRQQRSLQKNSLSGSRALLRSNSDMNLVARAVSPEQLSLSPQKMQRDPSGRGKMTGRGGRTVPSSCSLSISLEDEQSTQQKCVNGRPCGQSSRRKLYSAVPGRHFIAVRSYQPQAGGEISLQKNDRVRVLSVAEGGFWEGCCRGQVGWFPARCLEEIPVKPDKERPKSRMERSDRKKLFRHFTVGSYDSIDGDCVTEQKTVVLLKQEKEGFGFVLRGAKADTPIEEFIPTPAFPALQYLESVDEGGDAWQMGLRTGDFLIEVNHQNVVKMGHRQVVNMIKHGGNRLVLKVVTVSRNPEQDGKTCKKAPPPPKRPPTTALSMRSKSMTSELEELDKFEETVTPQKLVHEKGSLDKVATIKPRPSSRFLATSMDFNPSTSERPGVAVVPPSIPARSHGSYVRVPKSCMRRQKSIGIAGEEKKLLIPPLLKFTRSLSMPDTSEDIPPPPGVSPPSPPHNLSTPMAQVYEPNQPIYTQNSTGRCHTIDRDLVGYHRQNFEQYVCQTPSAVQQNMCSHNRAHVPENPYSDIVGKTLYIPPKPARRKGILVKQLNVEDSPEKTCSIPIPTIIVKEPSTSSSGKSSRGSSMEIETSASEQPGQLRPDGSHIVSNPFAAAIAGAVRDREKRLEACKNSPAFLSMDLGDEDPFIPTPRLHQSMSIDEGMFASDKSLQKLMAPPAALLEGQQIGSGGNMADFTIPEPTTEPLTTRTRSFPNTDGPISLNDGDLQNQTSGKTRDICPPLALGLAASNRALKEHVQPPLPPPKGEPHKANLNQPLFIDTKLRSNIEANFVATVAVGQAKDCGGLFRHTRDSNHETEKAKESNPSEQSINTNNTSQQKSARLLMVHTQDKAKPQVNSQPDRLEQEESPGMDSAPIDSNIKRTAHNSQPPHMRNVFTSATSVEEPVKFPCTIPPPPMTSVDIDEEFEPLPPPLEFANSIDVPEDQVVEILKQKNNNATIGPVYHSHASTTDGVESKCLSGLVNCMTPHTYPPPPPEMFEPITDSGIEEADSRNSGDPHFEANSTISTVSSISTLSSEGIDDTCIAYADGQTLSMDRPPVPPKPKIKPIINKSNALYSDPLIHESIESFGQPPPAPPPPLGCGAQSELRKKLAQRGSKLWDPHEFPNPLNADPKANVINELSSKLHQRNKDRFPIQGGSPPAGSRSIGSRDWTAQASGTKCSNTVPSTTLSHLPLQASSPASPPPESGRCSSLPGSAASPTLTDVFSLPSPPIVNAEQCYSLSSVSSRSPSPLTVFQASDKPFADKPILLWTKHDVADWLESLNLQEHKKAFLDNEIEGTHLPNLQKEDLVDLGVTRVGHRMNIEKGLKLLMDR